MAISDIYTARVSQTLASTAATWEMGLFGTAAKRIWLIGVRVEIENVGTTPAGNQVLFQLCRAGNSPNATGGSPASGVAHDFSAPASIGQFYASTSGWTTAPTLGNVLADWTLPQTSGSAWEEFPPLGYEWGAPALAATSANASNGIHMFITQNNSTSTTYVIDMIWSE